MVDHCKESADQRSARIEARLAEAEQLLADSIGYVRSCNGVQGDKIIYFLRVTDSATGSK